METVSMERRMANTYMHIVQCFTGNGRFVNMYDVPVAVVSTASL